MNFLEILFSSLPALSPKESKETISVPLQIVWTLATFGNEYLMENVLWVRYFSGLKDTRVTKGVKSLWLHGAYIIIKQQKHTRNPDSPK